MIATAVRRVQSARLARWLVPSFFPTGLHALSDTGYGDQDIRKRLGRFFDALRKTYPTLEYLWTAEANPGGTACTLMCVFTWPTPRSRRSSSIVQHLDRHRLGRHHAGPDHGRATYMGYGMKDLLTRPA